MSHRITTTTPDGAVRIWVKSNRSGPFTKAEAPEYDRKIAEAIERGLSNNEAAIEIGVSTRTISRHRCRLAAEKE